MAETYIEQIAEDQSSSMDFSLTVSIQNGRLSRDKRVAIARLLRKIIGGFVQQLNMVAEGMFLIELEISSPQNGVRQIDIGADE